MNREEYRQRLIAIQEYRARKYPIYTWADHIYTALCFVSLIVGIAYLAINQDPYGWNFILLFLVAFIGGALMGRVEQGWIWEWMQNDKNL